MPTPSHFELRVYGVKRVEDTAAGLCQVQARSSFFSTAMARNASCDKKREAQAARPQRSLPASMPHFVPPLALDLAARERPLLPVFLLLMFPESAPNTSSLVRNRL